MRQRFVFSLLFFAACGEPALDIELRKDPSVTETLVLLQPQIHKVPSSTPTIYPTVRIADGPFTLPPPETNHAFMIRIEACGEGEDCGVHNRIASACSTVMAIQDEDALPRIFLTFFPVEPGRQGCP